jgi:raffinose/stachyose/melibiose transport system substrate-binding protein
MAKSTKMRRRDFLKLSAGAAAFSILPATGRGAEASVARLASSLALQEQPDELVFWHMYFDDDANKGRVIKDFANSFESATGIKVELSQIVWTDHVKRMGVVGASQDKIPDVFVSGNTANGLKGMVAGGYVLPLNDLLSPEEVDQYLPALIQQCTIDGQLYALPQEVQVLALTANAKVLDNLGIETPTTIDELEAAFDKMMGAGITPYGLFLGTGNFIASWLTHILGSRTMSQQQADAIASGEAAFSDYAMPILETIERWASKGYFGPNPLTMEGIQPLSPCTKALLALSVSAASGQPKLKNNSTWKIWTTVSGLRRRWSIIRLTRWPVVCGGASALTRVAAIQRQAHVLPSP